MYTHTVQDDGTTLTTGLGVHIITAPGILPPFSTKVVADDPMWRVKPTYKGKQKSGGDGGIHDKHMNAWRGWPSVKHRTSNIGKK